MKTPTSKLATIACAVLTLLLLGGNLMAQEPQPEKRRPAPDGSRFSGQEKERRPGPPRPGDGPGFPPPPDGAFRFLSSEGRFGGKTVKGAPYSAVTETETIQTLSDGGRIVRKTTANIYRDGEGRTRHEQTLHKIGPLAAASPTETTGAAGDAPQIVFINDPVAGVNYTLDPRHRTARKMTFRGGPPPPLPGRPRHDSSDAKTESLGTQTIEGVEAEGTRSTVVIPAGRIGNERPIEIVTERWRSAALQEVILSKHNDPRIGEHIYRLKNINRGEPARALFEVPADYTLSEGRPFGGRGPGGPGARPKHEDNER